MKSDISTEESCSACDAAAKAILVLLDERDRFASALVDALAILEESAPLQHVDVGAQHQVRLIEIERLASEWEKNQE